MDKIKSINFKNSPLMIGALPSSYLVSLSYEEQLLLLCKKQEEIIKFLNNTIDETIQEYINEKFNDLIVNAMYEEETETLVLYLDNIEEV